MFNVKSTKYALHILIYKHKGEPNPPTVVWLEDNDHAFKEEQESI